jgi:type IV fimbrial biogenesis protein FimT
LNRPRLRDGAVTMSRIGPQPHRSAPSRPARGWGHRRASTGFTLVEIMVGLVLMTIILASVVPSFRGMIARVRLEGVFNELGVDLQYARAEALRRRADVALQLNGNGNGYAVVAGALTLKTVAMPDDVHFTGSTAITFDGLRGTATTDVTMDGAVDASTATLRVSVTPIGRLRLCSPGVTFVGYPDC